MLKIKLVLFILLILPICLVIPIEPGALVKGDSNEEIKACKWGKKKIIRMSPPPYILKIMDYVKNSFLNILK